MPRFAPALFLFLSSVALQGGFAQAVKEFHSSHGLVRISAVPEAEELSESPDSDAPVFVLDTLSDLTAMPASAGAKDPLFEVYLLESATGEELRFPAKQSHLRGFLDVHAGEFIDADPAARSVSMAIALSRELRVHMLTPGVGGTK